MTKENKSEQGEVIETVQKSEKIRNILMMIT